MSRRVMPSRNVPDAVEPRKRSTARFSCFTHGAQNFPRVVKTSDAAPPHPFTPFESLDFASAASSPGMRGANRSARVKSSGWHERRVRRRGNVKNGDTARGPRAGHATGTVEAIDGDGHPP